MIFLQKNLHTLSPIFVEIGCYLSNPKSDLKGLLVYGPEVKVDGSKMDGKMYLKIQHKIAKSGHRCFGYFFQKKMKNIVCSWSMISL